ncbi:MAG: porphobilinogen synthase, partial [Fuerstiella sp.]|nr:porphobilinogen synthase [Fuerstiella sp.]
FAMLSAAIENGWLEREQTILESLLACTRAGSDALQHTLARAAAAPLKSAGPAA